MRGEWSWSQGCLVFFLALLRKCRAYGRMQAIADATAALLYLYYMSYILTYDNRNCLRRFAVMFTVSTCVRSLDVVVAESGQEATVGD